MTTTIPRPVLETRRLELVPLTDEHLALEIELDSDPEVLRYLDPRAQTPAEVESAHRRRMAIAQEVVGLGFWVGFVAGEFVGWWTLQPPHGPDQPIVRGEADLGYRLLRRWWRHGLASEGSRELLRHGFDDVALNRIFAQTLASNRGSRAVMGSIGMTYVRSFSSNTKDPLPGIELGEVEYAITRQQWVNARW
jgi:RimJ/RimL family protein N-acetyltransferase